jgi:hypothetical protein
MKEAEVVYALAHIAPATPNEIADFMSVDSNVSGTVTNVWRDGLLVRRTRRRPDKMGSDPYEYALRPVEEEE